MVSLRLGRHSFGRLAAGLILAALVAACSGTPTGEVPTAPHPSLLAATVTPHTSLFPAIALPTLPPFTPTPILPTALPPLFDPGLDLLAGPVAVPLQLIIPALDVSAPVLGVGIAADNAMDAPKGPIDDPIWQSAFWYRGSGLPGDSGTAVFAGHTNDPLSRPAIFAHLQDLVPGDAIVVHDTRTGRDLNYIVTQIEIYSLAQSAAPAVLAQIYGSGPVAGQGPQPAPDGRAHLTLITCIGSIVNGSFDHHIVVFATLDP